MYAIKTFNYKRTEQFVTAWNMYLNEIYYAHRLFIEIPLKYKYKLYMLELYQQMCEYSRVYLYSCVKLKLKCLNIDFNMLLIRCVSDTI